MNKYKKRLVHPKMKILLSFINAHVVPNPKDLHLSLKEHTKKINIVLALSLFTQIPEA